MGNDDQAALGAQRTRRLISIALVEAALLVPVVILFVLDVIPLNVFVIALVAIALSFGALLFFVVVRPLSAANRDSVNTADTEVPGATGTTGSTREGYDPMEKFR